MGVVLVSIAGVSVDEGVEGSHESVLTVIVSEVVALEVVEEDVALLVEDRADLSALVKAGSHMKNLCGSVRDYLPA